MNQPIEKPGVFRPSWPATAAALVAMAALYVQGGRYVGLPVLALALLAVHAVDLRLPQSRLAPWIVRAGLFVLIALTTGEDAGNRQTWYADSASPNLLGYWCAAELVVQCWRRRSNGYPREAMLLLSAMVFVSATKTFEQRYIPIFAIGYTMLTVLALRDFRPRPGKRRIAVGTAGGLKLAAMVLAMGLGLGLATMLQAYGESLFQWSFAMLVQRPDRSASDLPAAPQLGLLFNRQPSVRRVLRLEGFAGELHLRAAAFDTYEQGGWRPTLDAKRFTAITPARLAAGASGRRVRAVRLAERMQDLVVPLNAAGVAPMDDSTTQWDETHGRALRSTMEGNAVYRYEFALANHPRQQGPLCRPPTPAERMACLAVPPEITLEVRELARTIAPFDDVHRRIAAVVDYLQTNCRYSLEAHGAEGDAVCDFLLRRHEGHCQYFASAAVILLRCVGIPSRYVNGYYAHEPAGANAMVVRQRDAHAWVECWIDGIGWITVDPTPAAGLPDQVFGPPSMWRRLQERLQDAISDARQWLGEMNWIRVALGSGAIAVAVAVLRWAWRHWKRRRSASKDRAYSCPHAMLAGIAARFERLLKKRNASCESARTWQEYLGGQASDEVAEFLKRYNAARFGPDCDGAALAALDAAMEKLEKNSGKNQPQMGHR